MKLNGLPGLPKPAPPPQTLVASVSLLFTLTDGVIQMHPQVWVPESTKPVVAKLLEQFAKNLRDSERKIVPAGV